MNITIDLKLILNKNEQSNKKTFLSRDKFVHEMHLSQPVTRFVTAKFTFDA